MITKRQGAEWLMEAYEGGYSDGCADQPQKRGKTITRAAGAPEGWEESLRLAYVRGWDIGQRVADEVAA